MYNSKGDPKCACSCAKFETYGVLCKTYSLFVHEKKNIAYLPEMYIMKRWTIYARYKAREAGSMSSVAPSRDVVNPLRLLAVRKRVNTVLDNATDATIEKVM